MRENDFNLEIEFDKLNKEVFNNELVRNFPLRWFKTKSSLGRVTYSWENEIPYVKSFNISKLFIYSREAFEDVFLHEMIHVKEVQTDKGLDKSHGAYFFQELERINSLGYNLTRTENPNSMKISSSIRKSELTIVVMEHTDSKQVNKRTFMIFKPYTEAINKDLIRLFEIHVKKAPPINIYIYSNIVDAVFEIMRSSRTVNGGLKKQYVMKDHHKKALHSIPFKELNFK